ncbi:unnamed protein product [Lepeophtheirus salmonis]|uniref:(salmon louse) hypothetical protein n=1 Tax=Lepeophtheirus salmonis TaxID=72036 RepID=A0A7R8H9Y0_LEPSM|nr:unnamed protein product [Lepeophtheirus salmonis]CAF2961799.1 unnamed protein product [Lepeophtheirus salmonis]
MVKEEMTAVADTLFREHKSKTEILSAIADVQLGAYTVALRVSALSIDLADPYFPKIVKYHCTIHRQAVCAKVMRFDHVMAPVIKIINSIHAKANQHRSFKLLLQDLSPGHSDLLLHTEVKWLSRRKILHRFCLLLNEIEAFMESREEDTTLYSDAEGLLDLAFLIDTTDILNQVNGQLQAWFEDRFKDFDKLDPCVAFMDNPFMELDITEISEKMAETFHCQSCENGDRGYKSSESCSA